MASSQGIAAAPLEVHFVNLEAKREAEQQRAQRLRQKQALNLQRENILSQRTSNPARRSALEAALRQIEAQIVKAESAADRDRALGQLQALEDEAEELSVPMGYTDGLYLLRTHIRFIRQIIETGQGAEYLESANPKRNPGG